MGTTSHTNEQDQASDAILKYYYMGDETHDGTQFTRPVLQVTVTCAADHRDPERTNMFFNARFLVGDTECKSLTEVPPAMRAKLEEVKARLSANGARYGLLHINALQDDPDFLTAGMFIVPAAPEGLTTKQTDDHFLDTVLKGLSDAGLRRGFTDRQHNSNEAAQEQHR